MTINVVNKIDNPVKVNTILISVSDKSGLAQFVPNLLAVNPKIKILSTGGTFNRIKAILGPKAETALTQVADYTGQPETQGGLVKTLDFKIYLGLLTETYNAAHQSDLKRTGALPIDMVVVNLYPFQKTISKEDVTPEQARGNIDIGGPCMLRASAKNFIRVASVVDPGDYDLIIDELNTNQGCTSLKSRFKLACKAFEHTALYDRTIYKYLADQNFEDISKCYQV
jgi:phosphoribosylaminoimidazolecarboxamide formyltransferase / IMP cyclohydrolase